VAGTKVGQGGEPQGNAAGAGERAVTIRGWVLSADLVVAVAAAVLREVRAMGLTGRDLVSSVTVLVMILSYTLLAYGAGPRLLSSAWAASAAELVLGVICAVSAAGDLHTRPQPLSGVIFRKITTVLGAIALVAGLAGLAASSWHAVEVLVVVTAFLWLTATIWHVLTIGSQP
jgi:hypothetical protein